jgi:predicted ester cyclase
MEGSLPIDQAIANRTNTITALVGEGDMVAARIRVAGKHVGKLYGVTATNKDFWFDEIAIFRLANGKITESWQLGNEGRFLIQVGEQLPARADGRIIPPPSDVEAYPGDDWVAKLSRNGVDSIQNRNKITVAKYNADRFRGGRTTPIAKIYDEYLHSGNQVTVDLMKEIEQVTGHKVPGSFSAAWSGRSDLLVNMIAEGDMLIMQFQLNALNAGPLYTIPATGKQIRSWEVLVAEFDGEKWKSAWWFGDDLGLYLKLGTEEALSFFFDDVTVPR